MKVLEFAFDSRDTGSASDYLPHNYPVNSVAYTGTHDNETLVSWSRPSPLPNVHWCEIICAIMPRRKCSL